MAKIQPSCLDCFNEKCILKQFCNQDILKEIDNNKIVNNYAPHHVIFHENNDADCVYFLRNGVVKIIKYGTVNKDQIIRFVLNGDIIGHRGFINSETYPVTAQSITLSQVCFLQKEYFFELLHQVPELSIQLMLLYANELHNEETKLRDLAIFNVREKVAKAILLLVKTFGINENNEIQQINLLSRQDIAECVGLTSNQITKVLSEFKTDNIIDTIDKKIKINTIGYLENLVRN